MMWSGRLLFLALIALGCDKESSRSHAGDGPAAPTFAPSEDVPLQEPKVVAPVPTNSSSPAPSPALRAPKQAYVVAALGDSITDARNGGGGYLKVVQEACPSSVFLNFGKGGDMTNQMLRRLQADILPIVKARKIDTLLVFGGVNDLYSDLTAGRKNEVIERDLSQIYAISHEAGLRVVALTVSPWGGFTKYWNPRRSENTQLLNSWILGQREAGAIDAVVDTYPLLSCGVEARLCDEYENRHADGLHPGPEGHRLIGEKLAAVAFPNCR